MTDISAIGPKELSCHFHFPLLLILTLSELIVLLCISALLFVHLLSDKWVLITLMIFIVPIKQANI